MEDRKEQERVAGVLLIELAQNIMLVGYESSSSRIQVKDRILEFTGFSGKLTLMPSGQLTLDVSGVRLVDTREGLSGVVEIDALIERFLRLNSELMDIYMQQVLSGD